MAYRSVGFTGTRNGMTQKQRLTVEGLIQEFLPQQDGIVKQEAHHGCCIGADVQFHHALRRLTPWVWVVGHPCLTTANLSAMQDHAVIENCDERRERFPPLLRNKHIIAESEVLIAAPYQGIEQLRSGTWSTIRHAVKRIPLYLITPNGTIRTHI